MFQLPTPNPSNPVLHAAHVRVAMESRGVSSAILNSNQCMASTRAFAALASMGPWPTYVPCVGGLPYHGPEDRRRATDLHGYEDGAYLLHCDQREVEEEFLHILPNHVCPQCHRRTVRDRLARTYGTAGHPEAEYSVLYTCQAADCDYEEL